MFFLSSLTPTHILYPCKERRTIDAITGVHRIAWSRNLELVTKRSFQNSWSKGIKLGTRSLLTILLSAIRAMTSNRMTVNLVPNTGLMFTLGLVKTAMFVLKVVQPSSFARGTGEALCSSRCVTNERNIFEEIMRRNRFNQLSIQRDNTS